MQSAIVRFLLLALIWLPLTAISVTDDDVHVEYRNGTYYAHLSARIAVPSPIVFSVLTDFDHMANFMPGLSSSRITSQQNNVYVVTQRGKVKFGPFSMPYESERRIEIVDNSRILSRSVPGSARRTQSEMRLQPWEQGTRLDYKVEIEPDSWLPSSLGINFLQHELAEQFNALGREMQHRQ
jgi:carbon monoxide dehydrogenase subunit G